MVLARAGSSKLSGQKSGEFTHPRVKKAARVPVLVITPLVLFFDQLTKYIIVNKLSLDQSAPLIKGIFHLTLVYNRGAAFGILRNQIPLFIFTSLIAIFLIYLNYKKNKESFSYNLSLALILAGALGNLIDRLLFGFVIDFLDFRIWPVFNIADSAITVGAFLLACTIFRHNKRRAA